MSIHSSNFILKIAVVLGLLFVIYHLGHYRLRFAKHSSYIYINEFIKIRKGESSSFKFIYDNLLYFKYSSYHGYFLLFLTQHLLCCITIIFYDYFFRPVNEISVVTVSISTLALILSLPLSLRLKLKDRCYPVLDNLMSINITSFYCFCVMMSVTSWIYSVFFKFALIILTLFQTTIIINLFNNLIASSENIIKIYTKFGYTITKAATCCALIYSSLTCIFILYYFFDSNQQGLMGLIVNMFYGDTYLPKPFLLIVIITSGLLKRVRNKRQVTTMPQKITRAIVYNKQKKVYMYVVVHCHKFYYIYRKNISLYKYVRMVSSALISLFIIFSIALAQSSQPAPYGVIDTRIEYDINDITYSIMGKDTPFRTEKFNANVTVELTNKQFFQDGFAVSMTILPKKNIKLKWCAITVDDIKIINNESIVFKTYQGDNRSICIDVINNGWVPIKNLRIQLYDEKEILKRRFPNDTNEIFVSDLQVGERKNIYKLYKQNMKGPYSKIPEHISPHLKVLYNVDSRAKNIDHQLDCNIIIENQNFLYDQIRQHDTVTPTVNLFQDKEWLVIVPTSDRIYNYICDGIAGVKLNANNEYRTIGMITTDRSCSFVCSFVALFDDGKGYRTYSWYVKNYVSSYTEFEHSDLPVLNTNS